MSRRSTRGNIDNMCDQTIPYALGTWVWAKLGNRIWWPGKIVDVSSVPKELEYYKKKNKNAKTAVYFERDKSYELIVNLDNVFLYSCSKKMEFIEKGYLLYHKKKKSNSTVAAYDMDSFVDDVLNVERDIGGDTNIFDLIIKKQQEYEESMKKTQINIKDLFITEKERKKRERIQEKRSLSSSANKSRSSIKNTPSPHAQRSISKLPVAPKGFYCPYCNDFSTNRFNILKLHMDAHKNESVDVENEESSVNKKSIGTKKSPKNKKSASIFSSSSPRARSSTLRKRKNAKSKVADSKKIKLQDELLKDWDDEDLDETDESIIQPEGNDTYQNKVDSPGLKNTNKVNESTSTRIFDFDENEDDLHESFQSQSSLESSDNISYIPRKAWSPSCSEIIFGTAVRVKNSDETTNSDNSLRSLETATSEDRISNEKNNLEGETTNVEIQDKADAKLEHDIEHFLGDTPGSTWVKESLKKFNQENGSDEGYLKTNLELQFDDLPEVPMTYNDVEYTTETVKMNPMIVDVDPHIPIDENDKPITIYFPKCAPEKTDEELKSSKEYKELMNIADNGGSLYLKINCPYYVKE